MKWSIQELFEDIRSIFSGYGFWWKIVYLPRNIWRSIKMIFYWIFTGFTTWSWWDVEHTMLRSYKIRLTHFKKKFRKHSNSFSSLVIEETFGTYDVDFLSDDSEDLITIKNEYDRIIDEIIYLIDVMLGDVHIYKEDGSYDFEAESKVSDKLFDMFKKYHHMFWD